MSVDVKLTSVKSLSNTSTTSIVEMSNFNFRTLVSAIKEFLGSINYEQGGSEITVDISNVDANWVTVRNGLKVYGAQQMDDNYPTVIELHPSGSITAKNFIAEDVTDTRRLRLRVYGLLPTTGIPGEMVYIEAQGNKVEGIYVWLNSTGWTLLAGTGSNSGNQPCIQEIIVHAATNVIESGSDLISQGIFLIPAPIPSSNMLLFINGLQTLIGDANKLMPAYFSKDGGSTASSIRELDASDQLFFNTTIAGYTLNNLDTATLHYFTVDPFCSQSGYSCITEVSITDPTIFNQFGISIIGTPSEISPITICHLPNPTTSLEYSLPSGYLLENSIYSYSITDHNGVYDGGAIIKFTLPSSITESEFELVKIFRAVSGVLNDVTVTTGTYSPDYANRWLYASIPGFSLFYVIQGVPITTLPPTTTTTTTAAVCPDHAISFSIPYGQNPTQATFYGTPEGPLTVEFVDQLNNIHDLTGLLGSSITLPWTFDINDVRFAEISTVIGVYFFTYGISCIYEVPLPLSAIGNVTTTTTIAPTTTTTTTIAPTTTTTTTIAPTTTTTTTIVPTTTTTTTIGISYVVDSPVQVTFFGSPSGPYEVVYTDSSENEFNLSTISGSDKTLPWVFNRTLQAYVDAGITTISGEYIFKINGLPVYTLNISI